MVEHHATRIEGALATSGLPAFNLLDAKPVLSERVRHPCQRQVAHFATPLSSSSNSMSSAGTISKSPLDMPASAVLSSDVSGSSSSSSSPIRSSSSSMD